MKIIKRIAEEQYCFTEIEFESLEEYKTGYPEFAKAMVEIKEKAQQEKENKPPFETDGKDPFAFQKSLGKLKEIITESK